MKLNLGCGQNKLAGYVNVDKHDDPDVRHDLECFPWPWSASSVDEVVMNHVLEHLGREPDVFIGIMKELYRVCAPGAVVRIVVPHPRHDHFLGDPTHVRVVTPEVLSLFSKRNCERWRDARAANTPLALYHGVDFEIDATTIVLERRFKAALDAGHMSAADVEQALRERNNVATEIRMQLTAIKALDMIDARRAYFPDPDRLWQPDQVPA